MPMLEIKRGIPASQQEGSFMNATLQSVNTGVAFSIAVHAPDHFNDCSEALIVDMLRTDLKHLTDIGYSVEVQIGEDDQL